MFLGRETIIFDKRYPRECIMWPRPTTVQELRSDLRGSTEFECGFRSDLDRVPNWPVLFRPGYLVPQHTTPCLYPIMHRFYLIIIQACTCSRIFQSIFMQRGSAGRRVLHCLAHLPVTTIIGQANPVPRELLGRYDMSHSCMESRQPPVSALQLALRS